MPLFVNPFKKNDLSEFPGVLVPLQHAPHRSSIARRASTTSVLSRKDEKDGKIESDAGSSLNAGLTIEALRAEIEADLAASEFNSSYDSTSCDTLYRSFLP